jgi:hypothetical protein
MHFKESGEFDSVLIPRKDLLTSVKRWDENKAIGQECIASEIA